MAVLDQIAGDRQAYLDDADDANRFHDPPRSIAFSPTFGFVTPRRIDWTCRRPYRHALSSAGFRRFATPAEAGRGNAGRSPHRSTAATALVAKPRACRGTGARKDCFRKPPWLRPRDR